MPQPDLMVFQGNVVDSNSDASLRVDECLIGVKDGKIIFREKVERLQEVIAEFDINKDEIKILSSREFLMPGFVDTHIHAPQFKFAGNHLDLTLLDWLKTYTLPTEASFQDLNVAEEIYTKVVERTLRTGTTTAVYFATLHLEASTMLVDLAEKFHQRAYIGKVTMDTTNFEDCKHLCENSSNAMRDVEEFIKRTINKQNPLITPVVTPRFALGCSRESLKELGNLAQKYDIPIQSHLAETRQESEIVKQYFTQCKNYTEIYHNYNLLTEKTIMAHGVYLSNEEINLLKKTGTGISHCPNSNISIRSGLCDVRKLHSSGVNVGLGTDVAAGYSSSMLDAIRYAVLTSKVLSMQQSNYCYLKSADALYLATLGGCKILKIDDQLGTLDVGKYFDALLINTNIQDHPLQIFSDDNVRDIIEKFIFQGDDRNIREIYVSGYKVF